MDKKSDGGKLEKATRVEGEIPSRGYGMVRDIREKARAEKEKTGKVGEWRE